MKKVIALLLSLLLSLGLVAPVMAEPDPVIASLKDVVDEYLKNEGYRFEYSAEKERYIGEFNLDSALGSCKVYIYLYDDMVSCTADITTLTVPKAYRDNMAIFLTLANGELYYAHLRMIYEEGYVHSRSAIFVESVLPSTKEIGTLVQSALWSLDEWGNGIVRVLTGADPHQTFQEVLAEGKKESNSF